MTFTEQHTTNGTRAPAATPVTEQPRPTSATRVVIGAGVGIEALVGAGVATLAIIGLAGVAPEYMAPLAVIAAGAAFLMKGAAVASRARELMHRLTRTGQEAELGSGVGVEMLAGVAGVTLGIIALADVARIVLVSVAVIGFGAAMLVGAGVTASIDAALRRHDDPVARSMVSGDAGGEVLLGLGVATLGILAVIGIVPETLALAALVAVGAAALLEASPTLARLLGGSR